MPYRLVKMRSWSLRPPNTVLSGFASGLGASAGAALKARTNLQSVHSQRRCGTVVFVLLSLYAYLVASTSVASTVCNCATALRDPLVSITCTDAAQPTRELPYQSAVVSCLKGAQVSVRCLAPPTHLVEPLSAVDSLMTSEPKMN